MEKAIIEHFKIVLKAKNGRIPMNSFTGHLSELSQKERKYIKKMGLEKLIMKYPNNFLIFDDNVHYLEEDEPEKTPANDLKDESDVTRKAVKSFIMPNSEDDPCTVCSDRIDIFAIGECSHPMCFKCSTKLRVLCQDNICPVCRQKSDMVVFSKNLLPFDQYNTENYIKDIKYGIAFETARICEQEKALLRHVCPKCQINMTFETFMQLEAHTYDKHRLHYCDICVRQCKIFTHERKIYTQQELRKHQEEGDDSGSARGGHPLCEYCNTRYLDGDELLRHLRLHHCFCHICDSKNEGSNKHQFYADLHFLNKHYGEAHYICNDPDCTADPACLSVFANDIELQSHKLLEHGGKKSKQEKKKDQQIDLPISFEGSHGLQFGQRSLGSNFGATSSRIKKILKIEPDPVGGIHCTGRVIWKIEKMFSFIERDDAPHSFEDNIFFDLESFGLQVHDDLREHVRSGDRVYVYALPANRDCKSKWKAQKVELIELDSDDADDRIYDDELRSNSDKDLEINSFPNFPALQDHPNDSIVQTSSHSADSWATKVGTQANRTTAIQANRFQDKANFKTKYEVGYIHKNLHDKYGFITKEKFQDNFKENVYFNLDSYRLGMQTNEYIPDMRNVVNWGEKVCYILETEAPPNANAQSKYRAKLVWKYSFRPEEQTVDKSISKPSEYAPVPSNHDLGARPKARISSNDSETTNLKSLAAYKEMNEKQLAMKYMMQLRKNGTEKPEMTKINDVTAVGGFVDSSYQLGNVPFYAETQGRLAMTPPQHVYSDLGGLSQESETNKYATQNMYTELIQQRAAAKKTNNLSSSDEYSFDENSSAPGKTTGVNIVNPTQNEDSLDSDDSSLSSDGEYVKKRSVHERHKLDLHQMLYFDVLKTCLKKKGSFKALEHQMIEEMKKKKSISPNNLLFVEFNKESAIACIMFIGRDSKGAKHIILDGKFPLESSLFGELKSEDLVVKISKDLYLIKGTSHYITVTRNKIDKVAKLTIHYRPPS